MSTHRRRPQSSSGRPPRFEVLEDRCCPAVSIAVLGGAMFVLGDSSANTVAISDQGNGTVTASISGASNSASRTASNINSIVVLTREGADSVSYQLTNPLTTARALLFDLGQGNDTATVDATAGVSRSALVVGVLGGDDSDDIHASIGAVAAGAYAALTLDGGGGDDTVAAT